MFILKKIKTAFHPLLTIYLELLKFVQFANNVIYLRFMFQITTQLTLETL